MPDPCSTCHKRRAVRGSTLCQRCERQSMHGPAQRFGCEACRDSGQVYAGECDIPGCRHFRFCQCEAGRTLAKLRAAHELPWDAT